MHKSGIALLLLIFPFFLFGQNDHLFALQNKTHGFTIEVDTLVTGNAEIRPFDLSTPIGGLAFSGDIALHSDTSLVRIILTDNHHNEYLIYEAYPILSGSGRFSVHEAAEETSLLNHVTPDRVLLEIIDASVHLKEFIVSEEGDFHAETKSSRMREQSLDKIHRINQNILKTGQSWLAGETSISRLSYQEKKSMFGGRVPNFHGFEYYTGGVFVLPGGRNYEPGTNAVSSANLPEQKSQYPDEFSWRNRHGKNWVTPVKHQGGSCGSCTPFGTSAAVELLVNLYFNQTLDYDLSEQQILSCNGSCEHGVFTNIALNYIKDNGIVLEDCFPYTASDSDCSEICNDPSERIRIGNWNTIYFNEEDKKRGIIQGATVGKLTSWVHVVQVVGYKNIEAGDILYMKDDSILGISIEEDHPLAGKTAWQIKNSWGTDWGTGGFGYVVENGGYLELYTIHGPVSSLVLNEEDISCTDKDGDGFYFWGIGPKPSHCPECPDQSDGDDSDPCIEAMDEYGNLFYVSPSPEAKDTIILYGNSPDLYVEGTDVRWYTDHKLQDLAYTGNLFPTGQTQPGKNTYYVTQTLSGCESNPGAITLSLVTGIFPPMGHDTTIDVGEPAVIAVEGEQGAVFKWYKDPSLTNFLATGDSYATGKTNEGVYTYYVTQTLCLIESPPDTVLLKIKDLVNIPDHRFREALVMEGVDQDGDKVVSLAEAEAVDSLSISFHDISDMSGIEAFVNLKYLVCSYNLLTSLDVTANPALAFLDCERNLLTSLDISGSISLGYLNCSNNQLTSLNISGCTALTDFDCPYNQLTGLDVSGCIALTALRCMENPIDSLDVSANTAITYLDCRRNRLTSLDVSANNALTGLDCSFNQLTSLDVSANNSLTEIDCSSNQLTSLDVSANTTLTGLDCSSNQLTSLDVSANTALVNLQCLSNLLTSLDISGCSALKVLNCDWNQLTSLDISGCTALMDLDCRFNQLASLDISSGSELKEVRCDNNPLTSLDVSGCTALEHLDCRFTQLASLDVSGCTALKDLGCRDNQLTRLDLSANSALVALSCRFNQITSLDVSANSALQRLNCSSNQLTSLDVSANSALIRLSCIRNQLTSLNVSGCADLNRLLCSDNQLRYLNLCSSGHMEVLDIDNMPTLDTVLVPNTPAVLLWKSSTLGSPNVRFIYCDVGIDDNISADLSVYPNPAGNFVTVETSTRERYSIRITALNGQLIQRIEFEGTTHQLDLSSFRKGVYLITFRSKDFVTTRKLIKL